MKMNRSLETLFCSVALMAGAAFASTGQAAEVGQCFDTAQLNQTMKDEGQRSMAFATQWLIDPRTGLRTDPIGHIFTSNEDGSRGYTLEADAPIGAPLKKICVTSKLHDVKFFDTTSPGVPEEALIHGDRARAVQFCKEKGLGDCGYHDEDLKNLDKGGERVLMLGRDDSGVLVTLTARVPGDGRGGLGLTFPEEGAYVTASVFQDVKKTPILIALLEDKKKKEGFDVAKVKTPPFALAMN